MGWKEVASYDEALKFAKDPGEVRYDHETETWWILTSEDVEPVL